MPPPTIISSSFQAALAHLESIIYNPFDKSAEQFEDADEAAPHGAGAAQDNPPKENGQHS